VHSLTQNVGDRRVFWPGCSCCTAGAWSSFVPLLQEVRSICKTRNQLVGWGNDGDEMRMITAGFVRAIGRFACDLFSHFHPRFQQVVVIRKTCKNLAPPGRTLLISDVPDVFPTASSYPQV
jgi:hypothetical protein